MQALIDNLLWWGGYENAFESEAQSPDIPAFQSPIVDIPATEGDVSAPASKGLPGPVVDAPTAEEVDVATSEPRPSLVVDHAASAWALLHATMKTECPPNNGELKPTVPQGENVEVLEGENVRMEYKGGIAAVRDNLHFGGLAPGNVTAEVSDAMLYSEEQHIKLEYTGKAANVSYKGTYLVAPEGDIDFMVTGGASQWIIGHTRESINHASRSVLFSIWEEYLENPLVKSKITVDGLRNDPDYRDTEKLRDFIMAYLAPENR